MEKGNKKANIMPKTIFLCQDVLENSYFRQNLDKKICNITKLSLPWRNGIKESWDAVPEVECCDKMHYDWHQAIRLFMLQNIVQVYVRSTSCLCTRDRNIYMNERASYPLIFLSIIFNLIRHIQGFDDRIGTNPRLHNKTTVDKT